MEMPRLDKSKLTISSSLDNMEEEMAYWRTRPPAERWRAMELMRRINYGEHATTSRLQRLLELADENDVRYLLIGGYAVGYHGYPRATADMDVWIAVYQHDGFTAEQESVRASQRLE